MKRVTLPGLLNLLKLVKIVAFIKLTLKRPSRSAFSRLNDKTQFGILKKVFTESVQLWLNFRWMFNQQHRKSDEFMNDIDGGWVRTVEMIETTHFRWYQMRQAHRAYWIYWNWLDWNTNQIDKLTKLLLKRLNGREILDWLWAQRIDGNECDSDAVPADKWIRNDGN